MPLALLTAAFTILGVALLGPGTTSAAAPVTAVRLVNTYPHDPTSFCQGLAMQNGRLIEGTGHYGESRLRVVDIVSGRPEVDIALSKKEFGEGVTIWNDKILQLTWREGYVIIYDAETHTRTGTIRLDRIDRSLREGWGITHNDKHLIISDGSSNLRFVDPVTFRLVRRMRVRDGRRYVSRLNELEFVNGEIFANVWYRDQIARIDPESGVVTGWLELKHLRPPSVQGVREAVLNGIAWDSKRKRLFVTGKNWPRLFEVSF